MSRTVKVLIILLSLSCFILKVHSSWCYICSGLTCTPQKDQLMSCKNTTFTADKVRCFFVAVEPDQIYRGCYEPDGTHMEYCRKYRFNLCSICHGQACNNKPIYQQDTRFSCRKCAQGKCSYIDAVEKIAFHTCPPFFQGHVPSCFTYFYYPRLEYYFSCANEMTLTQRQHCDFDSFFTVCRFCDYPNCNTRYYAKFRVLKHYRLTCQSTATRTVNCDINRAYSPVMACVYRPNSNYMKCATVLTLSEYANVINYEHNHLCYDEQNCNSNDLSTYNYCKKTFNKQMYPDGLCSVNWARCALSNWQNEFGIWINDRHCETRFKCTKGNECYYCDKSTATNICNKGAIETISTYYSCYYCNDALDCETMNTFTTNRTHFCIDTKSQRCFTYVTSSKVIRGCFKEPSTDPHLQPCLKDRDNCEICKGNLCNKKSTRMYCHVCHHLNPYCQYDQNYAGFVMCPGERTLNGTMGCYTMKRPDNLIQRGCYRGSFDCPAAPYECKTCNTFGCNNETYHHSECLKCEGEALGRCGRGTEYLSFNNITEPCPVYRDVPLCFVAYSRNNTLVERGCSSQKMYSSWLGPACDRKIFNCSFCDTPNCNYFVNFDIDYIL